MRKPQLLLLLAEARRLVGSDAPPLVVVGSQSFHAQGGAFLPESVLFSAECDLFLPPDVPARSALMADLVADLGPNSDFYARHGFYAHTVGAGTVIPPLGWRERLVPVRDEQGTIWAWALEVHDAAACKLTAGREKDFEFLGETIRAGAVHTGTLLERALLFGPTRLGGVLANRLRRLEECLRHGRLRDEAAEVARALASLARPAPSPGEHPSPPDARTPPAE